jgi:hypothetical protein
VNKQIAVCEISEEARDAVVEDCGFFNTLL